MLSEHHRNYSQSLQYFFNFGFLGPLHNLSIRLFTAAADKSFSVHSVIMKPLRKAILKLIRCRCTEGVRRKWKNSLTTHFKSVIIKPNGKMLVQSLSTHLNSVNRGEKFKCPECDYEATHRRLCTGDKSFGVQSMNVKQLVKRLLLLISSMCMGEKCLSVQSMIMKWTGKNNLATHLKQLGAFCIKGSLFTWETDI